MEGERIRITNLSGAEREKELFLWLDSWKDKPTNLTKELSDIVNQFPFILNLFLFVFEC